MYVKVFVKYSSSVRQKTNTFRFPVDNFFNHRIALLAVENVL